MSAMKKMKKMKKKQKKAARKSAAKTPSAKKKSGKKSASRATSASKATPVLVTLDDQVLDKPDRIIATLKRAGLSNVKHLENVGVVTGDATPSKLSSLRKVSGVRAVEESARIQLAPPDSPVQ